MRISIRERGINHALVLIELKYYGVGVVLCPTETPVDHFSEIHAFLFQILCSLGGGVKMYSSQKIFCGPP